MRFSFLFSVSCALSLSLASCSVDAQPDSSNDLRNDSKISPSDRVSLTDAYAMASIATKGLNKAVEVDPVIDVEGDTLMYFVNYEEGWKILSSDKRTPAVIAESGIGSISLSTENENLLGWLGMTAADMKQIIHLEDSKLNFTADQIRSHRQQWQKEPMRFQGDSLPILPYYNEEWELQSVATSEVFYDSLNHLVAAHWDQGDPYNYYCPPMDFDSGKKPVGCAPVACGELLQFLCSHYDIPFEFEWDSVLGNISEVDTTYHFLYCSTDKSPMLLRYLGNLLGAIYTDYGTGVPEALTRVHNFYYDSLGVTSTQQSYSANKVKQNLLNGIPVIVSSSGTPLSLNPDDLRGHMFIIDAYQRTLTMYQSYYTRLVGYPPILEERIDTSYSSPHISFVKMNWGWWTQWFNGTNDGWYSLTGDWYVDMDNDPEPDNNYYGDNSILCDFSYIL